MRALVNTRHARSTRVTLFGVKGALGLSTALALAEPDQKLCPITPTHGNMHAVIQFNTEPWFHVQQGMGMGMNRCNAFQSGYPVRIARGVIQEFMEMSISELPRCDRPHESPVP